MYKFLLCGRAVYERLQAIVTVHSAASIYCWLREKMWQVAGGLCYDQSFFLHQ
jgi:hypothetical protein